MIVGSPPAKVGQHQTPTPPKRPSSPQLQGRFTWQATTDYDLHQDKVVAVNQLRIIHIAE